MINNGVGYFVTEIFSPVLIHKGKGAPWTGLTEKIIQCHRQNYNWSYGKEKPIFILYEGLIRWQDD